MYTLYNSEILFRNSHVPEEKGLGVSLKRATEAFFQFRALNLWPPVQ